LTVPVQEGPAAGGEALKIYNIFIYIYIWLNPKTPLSESGWVSLKKKPIVYRCFVQNAGSGDWSAPGPELKAVQTR